MKIADLKINGPHGEAYNICNAAEGTEGETISVDFSRDWDGLMINACFKASNITANRLNIYKDAEIEIPPEITALRHRKMMVSFTGFAPGEGRPRISTPEIFFGTVCAAGDPSADPSTSDSLPVWRQMQSDIGNKRNLKTECKTDLVCAVNEVHDDAKSVIDRANSGEFNGRDGAPGLPGVYEGDTPPKDGSPVWMKPSGGLVIDTDARTCLATCTAAAAPPSSAPVTWYVPKTMPRPSANPGMLIDVFWKNGRASGLGYDVSLVWGEEGGTDNETIVSASSTTDSLTGEYSIPTEGTVRYQLEETNGRKHWRYVSGDIIGKQFSSATAAEVADKTVPGMELAYLPGMEIYLQLDKGNTADLMNLVPADGQTLPVYGNGMGAKTGSFSAGAILHLKNAGDHWQILNTPEDLAHGITGAKIGDLMQITAVDEKGVPTGLKPTTLEELEGKWELVESFVTKKAAILSRTYSENPIKALRIALNHASGRFSNAAMGVDTSAGFGDVLVKQDKFNLVVVKPENGEYVLDSCTGPDQYGYSAMHLGFDKLSRLKPFQEARVNSFVSYGEVKPDTTVMIWVVRA